MTHYQRDKKIIRVVSLSESEGDAGNASRGMAKQIAAMRQKGSPILRIQVRQSAIKRIRAYYRYQVVVWIESSGEEAVCPALYELGRKYSTGGVSVFAEINPQQML